MLSRIIKIYLESSPKLLQALRDAIAQDEAGAAEAIRQAAHSLKSSSANLGAVVLSDLCKELEQMGRDNRTTDASAVLSEIEKVYPLVCRRLAAECGDTGA